MNMNFIQEIPGEQLGDFKLKVKQWIDSDSQIEVLNQKYLFLLIFHFF